MFLGYYTEPFQVGGAELSKEVLGGPSMDSTDVESGNEEEGRSFPPPSTFPTLLPANFPTFDSPGAAVRQLGKWAVRLRKGMLKLIWRDVLKKS